MKKLILLFAMITISLSTMAMGFPQNTYIQKRALTENRKKIEIKQSFKAIEFESKTIVENLKNDENKEEKSFVEMIANFFVKVFFRKINQNKMLGFDHNNTKNIHLEFIAIKKEFDYKLVC